MSLADIRLAYLDEINLGYTGSFGEYLTTYYTKTYDQDGNFLGYDRAINATHLISFNNELYFKE